MRQFYPVASSEDPPKLQNSQPNTLHSIRDARRLLPSREDRLKAEDRWLSCQGDNVMEPDADRISAFLDMRVDAPVGT
jgi:hypothetical protein